MKLLIRYTFIALLMSAMACKPSQPKQTVPSSDLVDTDFTAYLPKAEVKTDDVAEQTPQGQEELGFPEGDVNVEVDTILTHLSERDLGGIQVYRILVYSGRARDKAEEIVDFLKNEFGNYEVEMTYEQPNYKVRVGYYFDRLTAHGVHTSLKKKFRSAFVVKEKMNADEIARRIKKANAEKAAAMEIDEEDDY
ncbi:SPOR domain-containing protein [Flammeovirga sp. EKP202]|uniref:SPOR domain-containing protein n=1 Tax=Flammeovirga sp. EKP202 TaxID=2770592 RepID=UPI00165F40F8|nr:SPOR domain-containing protein [Flammeovirga sp. EKP202]MBD0402616.1 SPOR domain-containing protein [Flammeovirga sp. EKP202]